jgi:hypothetical protein
MTKQHITSAILGTALVAAGVLVGGEAAFAYQGHMFAARGDLRAARAELNGAIPDKAGHRVNAIGLVDRALAQVNAGIGAGAR